jgi:hypothetical protein
MLYVGTYVFCTQLSGSENIYFNSSSKVQRIKLTRPGVNVVILKILSPEKLEKKMAIFPHITAISPYK